MSSTARWDGTFDADNTANPVTPPTPDNEPATDAGRGAMRDAAEDEWWLQEWLRERILAIEQEAAERASGGLSADFIEKVRDWRYSDEWIGMTLRARLSATPQPGEPRGASDCEGWHHYGLCAFCGKYIAVLDPQPGEPE